MIIVHLFGILIISGSVGCCESIPNGLLSTGIAASGSKYTVLNYIKLLTAPKVLQSPSLFTYVDQFVKKNRETQTGIAKSYFEHPILTLTPTNKLIESIPDDITELLAAHALFLLMVDIEKSGPIIPEIFEHEMKKCSPKPSPECVATLVKILLNPATCPGIFKKDEEKVERLRILLFAAVYVNVCGSFELMDLFLKNILCPLCGTHYGIIPVPKPSPPMLKVITALSKELAALMKTNEWLKFGQHYNEK